MAKRKKYYAVAVGKTCGIYTDWYGPQGAERQVRGFPGAVYKGFGTLAEAEAFLKKNRGKPRISPVSKRDTDGGKKTAGRKKLAKPPESERITIYTDGGALNNPGPGGYGVVIVNGDSIREISGGFRLTTNNRMELMACIIGLRALEQPSDVSLFSDSRYVVDGITKGWAERWKANGWMRTKTEPAVNSDLWESLLELYQTHTVRFHWVRGHTGIAGNERCDQLAVAAASKPDLPADTAYEKTLPTTRQ